LPTFSRTRASRESKGFSAPGAGVARSSGSARKIPPSIVSEKSGL
jgi:hypothetical protein